MSRALRIMVWIVLGTGVVGILLGTALCIFVGTAAISGVRSGVETVTASRPPAVDPTALVKGNLYWVAAPSPWDRVVDLYTKPAEGWFDLEQHLCAVIRDATRVTFVARDGPWCYIECLGCNPRPKEGWLRCNLLLDYEPTPVPTPNITPQRPTD